MVKGDTVTMIEGKRKGETGTIIRVYEEHAIVETIDYMRFKFCTPLDNLKKVN